MKNLIAVRNLLALGLIAFSLVPCPAVSADSILVQEFNFAAAKDNPLKTADDYVAEKATGNPVFSERKRLIPVYFSVTFQEEAQTHVQGRGLVGVMSGGEAKNSIWLAKLKGLTPELRQKVTDELFADFVADLRARGFDVVTPDQLAGSETFQEILKAAKNNWDGADQLRTTKDNNVFWQVVPRGMPLPEIGFMAPMAVMKNVSKVMVDAGKASAFTASIAINVVKLTGIGSADGSRSADNDTLFGLALPIGSIEGKLGFSMQMIPYNGEYEQHGEKHFSVYNSQYVNGLHYNLSKTLETAAVPIGEGKFVKDNKMAGAVALGLTLLGARPGIVTPVIEYEVAVDPNKYADNARKLVDAARSMAFEKARQKYFRQ